jgi:dolichol-phosphate mannosyltransferase
MMNVAIVVPMANEADDFQPFIDSLSNELDKLRCGTVYLIVDTVSKDNTRSLCQELSDSDSRFITVWAPENRNVVDAYLKGYQTALQYGHDFIIEMDAGLSHDPKALPLFLQAFEKGYDCVFGSRFCVGGSICDSNWKRTTLSKGGTLLSNLLLGTSMSDMTSGYQGFSASVVGQFVHYPLLSRAHFYQTELRFLLRKKRYVEIPIRYRAPSPSVSKKAISNAVDVLLHYCYLRLVNKAPRID